MSSSRELDESPYYFGEADETYGYFRESIKEICKRYCYPERKGAKF